MRGFIDNIDFINLENQRYWSFPKNYKHDIKAETKEMIFSGNYIGSVKHDGAFYKFIKDEDGNQFLLSRSRGVDGDFAEKFEWVPHLHDFFSKLPNGTCLLGELYFPKDEGSRKVTTIMGCLVNKAIYRQQKGTPLSYYIFDVLAWDNKSIYQQNIEERVTYLDFINTARNVYYNTNSQYIRTAQYFEGEDLWNTLQKTLSIGGEGIVITKKGTCYQPGKRTARQSLKVKKELHDTIDCFFTGNAAEATENYTGKYVEIWTYWFDDDENKKIEGALYDDYKAGRNIHPITKSFFYGIPGSLEIGVVASGCRNPEFSDIVSIGWLSGLTEEIKINYKDYAGKVIEVSAMMIEKDSNALRHAKMVQFRSDKKWQDCRWEDIFEK